MFFRNNNGEFMGKKAFFVSDINEQKLSNWGSEYNILEKILVDHKSTDHMTSGIIVCKGNSKAPLHYHNVETFHYVLYGSGILTDRKGNKYELKPGITFYCALGSEGAHCIENNDDFPLAILWVHAYPKGTQDDTTWI